MLTRGRGSHVNIGIFRTPGRLHGNGPPCERRSVVKLPVSTSLYFHITFPTDSNVFRRVQTRFTHVQLCLIKNSIYVYTPTKNNMTRTTRLRSFRTWSDDTLLRRRPRPPCANAIYLISDRV